MKLEAKNRYIVHINPQAAGYSRRQIRSALPHHGGAVPRAARRDKNRHRLIHPDGGQQQWLECSGAGTT